LLERNKPVQVHKIETKCNNTDKKSLDSHEHELGDEGTTTNHGSQSQPLAAPMATSTSTSLLPPLLPAPASRHLFHPSPSASPRHLRLSPATRLLRAARRRHPDAVVVVPDARPWVGDLSGATASYREGGGEDEDDAEDDDDEDEDRSLDLLARFLHSVFRKASRRARRAVRSVLPPSVPAELVRSALLDFSFQLQIGDAEE
jgi:hypothetical protein